MILYGSLTSPYVRHCRLLLLLNQDDFVLQETDLSQSACLSPSKKIPFLKSGDIALSDSTTILRFLREQHQQAFLKELSDHDLFCLISTLMDSAINVFYLEKEGLTLDKATYLERQHQRVLDGLNYLESHCPNTVDWTNDYHLRLAIFLDWGLFRQRFKLDKHPQLQAFLNHANENVHFLACSPQ